MTAEVAPWLDRSRWPTVPIRYVASLGTGHTPSRQHPEYWEDCTIPWVTLADVGQLRDGTVNIITSTSEMISRLGLANSAAVKHPAGTVVLSRTASVGFSAILGSAMATSQDFATWTCGPKLDPRYLLHALRAMAPDLKRLAMGSTHKTIYMPDIAELRVPLPPLDEQRRIADFLDAEIARIDALSTMQREVLTLVAERRAAFLEDHLVTAQIAMGAPWIPLQHLTDQSRPIMYGIVLPGPSVEDGVPIVKGGDVAAGRLRPDLLSRTTREIESGYARSRLKGGDVVIAIRGSVGEVAVVPHSLKGANLTQDAARISRGPETDMRWLELVLQTSSVAEQIKSRITGATVRGINIWDLKRILIPTPGIQTQQEAAAKLDDLLRKQDSLSTRIRTQLELLAERKQALITAAVTGQFDVTTGRGADLS